MYIRRLPQFLFLGLALFSLATSAREPSVRPGINAPFENPALTQWLEAFEREGREIWDKRLEIVAALELKPGMTQADIGAGTVFFRASAGAGGRTRWFGVCRRHRTQLRRGDRTARPSGRPGLDPWHRHPPDRSGLPNDSVDLVFTSDTHHHVGYPQSMLASIHRALRPGGSLVMIDFDRIPGLSTPWILTHVRAGKQTASREFEAYSRRYRCCGTTTCCASGTPDHLRHLRRRLGRDSPQAGPVYL